MATWTARNRRANASIDDRAPWLAIDEPKVTAFAGGCDLTQAVPRIHSHGGRTQASGTVRKGMKPGLTALPMAHNLRPSNPALKCSTSIGMPPDVCLCWQEIHLLNCFSALLIHTKYEWNIYKAARSGQAVFLSAITMSY
jgi:hypothetical protein